MKHISNCARLSALAAIVATNLTSHATAAEDKLSEYNGTFKYDTVLKATGCTGEATFYLDESKPVLVGHFTVDMENNGTITIEDKDTSKTFLIDAEGNISPPATQDQEYQFKNLPTVFGLSLGCRSGWREIVKNGPVSDDTSVHATNTLSVTNGVCNVLNTDQYQSANTPYRKNSITLTSEYKFSQSEQLGESKPTVTDVDAKDQVTVNGKILAGKEGDNARLLKNGYVFQCNTLSISFYELRKRRQEISPNL